MRVTGLFLLGSVLSASLLMSGCGGGSGGGATTATPATISATNYKDLAVAATEASKRATEASSASAPSNFGSLLFKSSGESVSDKIARNIREAATDISQICTNSGSASFDSNADFTSGSITYSNCALDASTIFNGSYSFSGDVLGGTYTATFNNFSMTFNGSTQTVNGTVSCVNDVCNDSGLSFGETVADTTFSGSIDNRSYEIEGTPTVNENVDGSFNVDATVVDPNHGSITIDANNLSFGNCSAFTPGVQPDNGTITVTGSGGATATITFTNCESFTITFQGATETFFWDAL